MDRLFSYSAYLRWDALKQQPSRSSSYREVEDAVSQRLQETGSLYQFWALLEEIRRTGSSHHRFSDLVEIYLTTAFGLAPDGFKQFLASAKRCPDFSSLEMRRKPDISGFWQTLAEQRLSRPLTAYELDVVCEAGHPGVFLVCLLLKEVGELHTTDRLRDLGPKDGILFWPTEEERVERMLRVANLQPGESVMDLGSGDGRMLICAAEKFLACGLGIEFDPFLVDFSRWRIAERKLEDRVSIRWADFFSQDFSGADVTTLYLIDSLMKKLGPKLLREMKPGARAISHWYAFPRSIARRACVSEVSLVAMAYSASLHADGPKLHLAQF